MDPSQLSGFTPHVQNQFLQMSENQRGRGQHRGWRGQHRNGRSVGNQNAGNAHPTHTSYQHQPNGWAAQATPPSGLDSFPPLGTSQQAPPLSGNTAQHNQIPNQTSAREFFEHARGGGYRGRGRRPQNFSLNGTPHQQQQFNSSTTDNIHRPPHGQGQRFFSTSATPRFISADQQRAQRHRIMEQSDYLNHIAELNLRNLLSKEEQQEKHSFRKELETLAQEVAILPVSNSADVKLECYGSLANSFGVAGCDMDLMLTVRTKAGLYENIDEDTKRALEKIMLDAGYGARLLTNTRVPILRVCQRPNKELLRNLRDYRQKWEQSLLDDKSHPPTDEGFGALPELNAEQELAAATAWNEFDDVALDIPLPPSPMPENAKLEYIGDCGIQCDINFTNHVALHNTKLLWTYGQCDIRVRQMGIFVKNWAKARDINTPYRGTLSSYGYVLMVLHFLMNIANPPLIPNLQQIARDEDSWFQKSVDLFEGFDVRFKRDTQQVKQIISAMPKNHESLGSLLRGFFFYYATHQGFNWTQDVISIRVAGGLIPKRAKGWTEAKWSAQKQNVRLRYLCAIEDPFEVEHNVARTVGHGGIVAIRDEFRRAWRMIEGINRGPQPGTWVWSSRENTEGGNGDDLIASIENRGDLLKKDHEERKQKLRQMKQDLEAREELLKHRALQSNNDTKVSIQEDLDNGMSTRAYSVMSARIPVVDDAALKLIHNRQHQDFKLKMLQRRAFLNKRRTVEDDQPSSLTDARSSGPVLAWSTPLHSQIGELGAGQNLIHSDTSRSDSSLHSCTEQTTTMEERFTTSRRQPVESCSNQRPKQELNVQDRDACVLPVALKAPDHAGDKSNVLQATDRQNLTQPQEELEFVREQRLAFFNGKSRIERSFETTLARRENAKDSHALKVKERGTRQRKDSGVEGSWNGDSAPQVEQPNTTHANISSQGQSQHTITSETECNSLRSQMGGYLEDKNVREFVKSLSQVNRLRIRDRLEDDNMIIPFPSEPHFPFDPRQLMDLKIIEAGGNACAAQGWEFLHETSESSWIGGGAMAMALVNDLEKKGSSGEHHNSLASRDSFAEEFLKELPHFPE